MANVIERPDGVKIAGLFIAAILVISFLSRLSRAFELRVTEVVLDSKAQLFIRDCSRRTVRLVANEPDARDAREYAAKLAQVRHDHGLHEDEDVIFVEVTVTDASDFENVLDVHGAVLHGRYRVLTFESATVPNALAALLLHIRDETTRTPRIYFEWTEGNPVLHFLRFLLFGVGEVAPMTREVLRRAEPDRAHRPHIIAG